MYFYSHWRMRLKKLLSIRTSDQVQCPVSAVDNMDTIQNFLLYINDKNVYGIHLAEKGGHMVDVI